MSTITISPTADTYVSEGETGGNYNTNFGTAVNMAVGQWPKLLFSPTRFAEILMRFSLSDIPPNSIITSAKLHIFCGERSPGYTGCNDVCTKLGIRDNPVGTRTWVEMGVTWNNKPVSDPNYPNVTFNSGADRIVDITSYISDQYIIGVDADFTIARSGIICIGYGMTYYRSKEYTNTTRQPYLEVVINEGPPVLQFSSDKTSAKTGESITFSGKWPTPNQDINIYYWVDRLIGPHEHVVKARSDANGDYIAVGILPFDAHNQQDQPITGPSVLRFQACRPDIWPFECVDGTESNIVSITISPGTYIGTAPGTYTKNYPMASTYSGPAVVEPVTVKTLKFFDFAETKAISQEEAMFNILMATETAALHQGLVLLTSSIKYSEDLLYYIFDIEFTYVKPAIGVGGLGIYGLVVPVLLWYAALGIIVIIGLYIVYQIVGVARDIIFSPAGALLAGGIGIILIAGAAMFILPKLLPAARAATGRAKELAKGELEKRGVTV